MDDGDVELLLEAFESVVEKAKVFRDKADRSVTLMPEKKIVHYSVDNRTAHCGAAVFSTSDLAAASMVNCPACLIQMGRDMLQVSHGTIREPAMPGDCGYDLFVSYDTRIDPHSFAKVHLDARVAIPMGYWGLITARSSTNINGQLLVLPGVIDAGYRGELMAFVHNLSGKTVTINRGDSLAQMIFIETVIFPVLHVDSLPSSDRGEKGFGSTGNAYR